NDVHEPSPGIHDIDRRLPRWPLRAIGAEPKEMPLQPIGALEQVKRLLPHPHTLVTALHRLSPEAIAGRRSRKRWIGSRQSEGKMGPLAKGAILPGHRRPRAAVGFTRLALSRFSLI